MKINKKHHFDIYFNDAEKSNNKGFKSSYDECLEYINMYNGTNESYFEDYKGGTVSIYDIEADEFVFEIEIL